MTQPHDIDYTFLIFPFIGPSEESLAEEKRLSGKQEHRPFVRKADKPKRSIELLGTEDKGIMRLLYRDPKSKHLRPSWAMGCMQDNFDRPGSADALCYIVVKEIEKDKKRKRALKAFLRDEKKSRRVVYSEHMTSAQWKFFRERIVSERGGMCERCGKSGHAPMNVHHLTYARLGHELPDDVKVYCLPCHRLMHPGWE